jgi:adenylate cyclase
VDWAAEGLLEGLEGDQRAARAELLDQLHEGGVPVEELRRAVAEERLALLPVELVLAREEHYTAAEVAERSGIDLELLLRLQQAFGMPVPDPDEPAFSDAGVEAMRRTATFMEAGLPAEGVIEVTRVIGQSMARTAETMRALVNEALRPEATSERDLGLGFARLARELAPLLGPMLEDALRAHLVEQIRSDVVDRAELARGRLPGAREVTVAFADMVGFTRLGERRSVDQLGALAGRLAELAEEVAVGPVRLVKTIGDAAMLVSPEPDPLLAAALALVEAAEDEGEDFPQLRAGAAAGPAINRGGDWYGHPVNVASRLTGVARAGSVLATAELRDAAGDGYRWSFAGQRRLRGVRRPVRVYRARWAEGQRNR